MPGFIAAGLWGLLGGSALVLGAAIGYFAQLSPRLVASIMAVGAGVLVSALSLELMAEAAEQGGILPTSLGFVGGASVYTLVNLWLSRRGAKHRKRSGDQQRSEGEASGSGVALAVGALLDGIPESIVIGVSLLRGGAVSAVAVAAVFLSNLPEGLSSAAGMKRAGRSAGYIFGVWGAIACASGLAAMLGYVVLADSSLGLIAAINAVAAGAILAMLADTMIPEASEGSHGLTGILTVLGFLVAFLLRWHERA